MTLQRCAQRLIEPVERVKALDDLTEAPHDLPPKRIAICSVPSLGERDRCLREPQRVGGLIETVETMRGSLEDDHLLQRRRRIVDTGYPAELSDDGIAQLEFGDPCLDGCFGGVEQGGPATAAGWQAESASDALRGDRLPCQ